MPSIESEAVTRVASGSVNPRRIAVGALIAGVFALAFLVLNVTTIELPPPGSDAGGYVLDYRPPTSGFEAQLDLGDGQAYAWFAMHPTLDGAARCCLETRFLPPLAERPAFIYLVWLTAAGSPSILPFSFTAVQVAALAALAGLAMALTQVRARGQDDRLAALVVLLPGALISLHWYGPELLAVDLFLAGLFTWITGRRGWAALWFALAILTRELIAVGVLAVGLHELWHRRGRVRWRDLLPLAAGPILYVGWASFVHRRMGLPASQSTGLIEAPWNTYPTVVPGWAAADFLVALVAVGIVVAALVRHRSDVLTWAITAFGLLALTLNSTVLTSLDGFARVLLPLFVLGVLVLLPVTAESRVEVRPEPAEA